MKRKKASVFWIILLIYILFLFCFAVITREPKDNYTVRLDLFWSYFHPSGNGYRDVVLNLLSYIPIGIMVGLISKKYRIGKAMLLGFLVSIVIELSQLIWKKGFFDVDDLFNNVVGALIGGLMMGCVISIRKNAKTKRI
jgi:glycopeptide antibiotics resistance protein